MWRYRKLKRVGFLKQWSVSAGILIISAVFSTGARADLLSAEDRVQLLYSNRFIFDNRGVPLIRVSVMEGRSEVTVESEDGLVVLPSGPGGPEVLGGKTWKFTIGKAQPAKVRYWTVLGRHSGPAAGWGSKMEKLWKEKGVDIKLFETGSVFAVSGNVVDNRSAVAACCPRDDHRVASRIAALMGKKHGIRTGLHAELVERSKGVITAESSDRGLSVRNEGMIWLAPAGGGRITVRQVEHGKGYSWHGFADRTYWGMVYIAVDRNGKLAVVNAVSADRILAGLVPAEIFPSAPMEALKAQAVAARGQLLAKLGKRHLADPYPLCAAQHCQVYSGAGREHPRTTRAVNETRGLILMDAGGRLADTVYHSTCGGHTEHNENVWQTPPRGDLRGRADIGHGTTFWHNHFKKGKGVQGALERWLRKPPDTYCSQYSQNKRSVFRWKERRSAEDLTKSIGRSLGVGRVLEINVVARGVSGRAKEISIRGEKGAASVTGELNIRRKLGNLKSSMFIVRAIPEKSKRPKEFEFKGGGWGHGVGMCQMGAMGMARAGHRLNEILSFYYRNTKLIRLY